MFGFSVLLSVLALAGAPASTPVSCNPALTGTPTTLGTFALTYWNGTQPQRIEFGITACRAFVYLAATAKERVAIRRLNPGIDWPSIEGGGLLVALHESTHVALKSRDECVVEQAAFPKLDALIAQYVPKNEAAQAKAAAVALDAQERSTVNCPLP